MSDIETSEILKLNRMIENRDDLIANLTQQLAINKTLIETLNKSISIYESIIDKYKEAIGK